MTDRSEMVQDGALPTRIGKMDRFLAFAADNIYRQTAAQYFSFEHDWFG